MRILFIVQHPIEGPSSRYRVYQFLPYLHQQGVETCIAPFLSSSQLSAIYQDGSLPKKIAITLCATAKRLKDLLQAEKYDIAYIVREAYPFGPPIFEYLFQNRCKRMIFDFDDAIYTPSLAYHNPLDRLHDWEKAAKLIRVANHVVTGSEYLAQYAVNQGCPTDKLSVIPTVVDTGIYTPLQHSKPTNSTLTIGWIGTPRGTSYVEQLLPVMAELSKKHRNIKFLLIGAKPFDSQDLPIEFKTWRLDDEITDVQSFDIGIMPLTDDEESRGKCGFKLIQYLSVGIPAVCSPVGANINIIENGRSGFFATTPQEWLEKLNLLIENGELRRELGRYGRSTAERSFSLRSAAPELVRVLDSVMSTSR